jgi:ATP-dependent helicase/nuclease subunit A
VTPDQAVRDAIDSELGATLFVEAGAGTGKTTKLVDRVVALVTTEAPVRMEHIAVITFTEAASAELRDRLAQKFERLDLEECNELAAEAARALDSAAVTTLHGFARKILSEHPFEVGLPPVFDVADASSDRVAFDERWSQFSELLLGDPRHEDLVVRALTCGLSLDHLRDVALECHRNWDLLVERPDERGPAPAIDPTTLIALLEEAIALGDHCLDPEDKLLQALRGEKSAALAALRGATDEIDLLQVLVEVEDLGKRRANGRKQFWPDGGKEAVADRLLAAESERARLFGDTAEWVVQGLLALLVGFTLGAASDRRSSGHLVFHDLLVLARNLVRDHPTARRALHRRYTHLLIDEFQDTDPIQAELALTLAADPDVELNPEWLTQPVPAGRLFFVGDPKQSVYRFRRADVDLFLKTREHVVDHAEQLSTNFRSRPDIVSWINAVFGRLFGDGVPGMQPRYEPLSAHEDKGAQNPRSMRPVIVLGAAPSGGLVTEVREDQARDVAAAIATLHAEEWPVGEGARPMRFDDVAVLIRARTGLDILERAFDQAGIPYRLESSSLVYESDEVQRLLAILRAIDDPADAVSTLAALRSPAFGCGDDELSLHRAEGGHWDWRATSPPDTEVAKALSELAAAHQQCWWESVSALVGQVVADHRMMALALSEARPRESWRRIRYLVDQARLFDEANGGDLRAFLRWVAHQEEDDARVTEAIVPETDDDAVRVLTVHGAKGLEFPVVAVLGLVGGPPPGRESVLFPPTGPEVRFTSTLESPGFADAAGREKEMAECERVRLLYVAATRAEHLLLVSLHRGAKAESTLAGQVMAHCEQHPELWSDGAALCEPQKVPVEVPVEVPVQVPVPRVDTPAEVDDSASREAFETSRQRLLDRMRRPSSIGATGVRSLLRPDDAGGEEEEEEDGLERAERPVHRRGRAGTAIGRAVHAVLQVIDLDTGEGLDALAHAQAVAEGVSERAREIGRRVRAALDSGLVREAVRSGRYWREMYVGIPVGSGVLEGFIDLLFETPEGLVIVDYKTDRLEGPGDDDGLLERYRLQGASYALAVERALGRPVARCAFLVLTPTGAVALPLDGLSDAVTEVTDLLAG